MVLNAFLFVMTIKWILSDLLHTITVADACLHVCASGLTAG
jgi:hypothetical protein